MLSDFAHSPAPQWLDLQRSRKGAVTDKGDSCGQVCIALWLGPEVTPQETGETACWRCHNNAC